MGERIVRASAGDGTPVGEVDRVIAHREGIWHASVHVWIVTAGSDLVLQRRAPTLPHFPDRWDISAAGHLRVGEDGLAEVAEELGVHVDAEQLEDLGRQRLSTATGAYICNEWAQVFLWRSDLQLEDMTFTDGEVTAVASLPPASFDRLLDGNPAPAQVWDGTILQRSTLDPDDLTPMPAGYRHVLMAALTEH